MYFPALKIFYCFLPLFMRLGGFGTTLSKVFFVSFGQTLFNMALNSLSFSLRLSAKKEEF